MEARKAQLEAMQSSKQSDFERDFESDFERDFERDAARNAKVLANPTTLARAPAPNADAGAALASVAEHEKACSRGDFERPVGSRHARAVPFEPPVAAEHSWAAISSAKHALCGVFECCRRG